MFPGAVVYRSDGASRGQGVRGRQGDASYGAVRMVEGIEVWKCGGKLDDTMNNVAEYCGMIACVNDACNRFLGGSENTGDAKVVFQLDSMLVTKQGNLQWRCLSLELAPYYEKVIEGIRLLEENGLDIHIMHIYREFNTIADGLANEVLNTGTNISDNWCSDVP